MRQSDCRIVLSLELFFEDEDKKDMSVTVFEDVLNYIIVR